MRNEPTDAELDILIDDVAGLDSSNEAFRKFASAVLAKWGTPQPVVREPLTRKQIDDLAEDGVFLGNIYEIAQAIEAAHGITQKGGQHGTDN